MFNCCVDLAHTAVPRIKCKTAHKHLKWHLYGQATVIQLSEKKYDSCQRNIPIHLLSMHFEALKELAALEE